MDAILGVGEGFQNDARIILCCVHISLSNFAGQPDASFIVVASRGVLVACVALHALEFSDMPSFCFTDSF